MVALMKDPLAQAQVLRALGNASAGGADVGECLAVLDAIGDGGPDEWCDAWGALGERLQAAGEASLELGDEVGARSAFFRAANAFRTAWVMVLAAPITERLRIARAAEISAFDRGAALLDVPPVRLDVGYDRGTLHASLFRVADDAAARPTLILTTGYDGSAQELFFGSGVAALERGWNVVTFEGPGQGSVLLDDGVPMRPDWENVVTPIVDALVGRDDVDPHRIALMGLSLGGYLAPRAATREHRLAACISDCGPYDVSDAAIARVPVALRPGVDAPGLRRRVLRAALERAMAKPYAGWALRRNLLVHGLDDPVEYFRVAREYSLKGREADIRCPTFVCTTDRDDLSRTGAVRLFERLRCEKRFVEFRAADGAGDHCEAAARLQFHLAAFGWLDEMLRPVGAAR